ncbi:MAG: antitoxin [Candidatus Margulisbacteria bacterium]|nr:antitoxin [Candidatus Margulisiibacteriota bacterium]
MKRKKTVFKLDPYEQSIEDRIETFVPASAETRARFAEVIERARKSRNVNLRFNGSDLGKVKQKAGECGLPYQTFITMVLHKYVTDQFIDRHEAHKVWQAKS